MSYSINSLNTLAQFYSHYATCFSPQGPILWEDRYILWAGSTKRVSRRKYQIIYYVAIVRVWQLPLCTCIYSDTLYTCWLIHSVICVLRIYVYVLAFVFRKTVYAFHCDTLNVYPETMCAYRDNLCMYLQINCIFTETLREFMIHCVFTETLYVYLQIN